MRLRMIRNLAPIFALLLLTACATSQVQKARVVSVDVHAVLAAVDDAEQTLYTSKAVPVTGQTKADLTAVSAELEAVTELVKGVLPPNSTVVIALTAAKDAILRLLPLFLEG